MVNAEISLLMRLRHPNIIQLKEAIYSAEKERMFIVLEYCSKGSLLTVLNSRLTVEDEEWHEEVRGYFRQMVEAISFSMLLISRFMKTRLCIETSNLKICCSANREKSRSSTLTFRMY